MDDEIKNIMIKIHAVIDNELLNPITGGILIHPLGIMLDCQNEIPIKLD